MGRVSPIFSEPARDPKLADALRRIDESQASEEELERLRLRILEAARPALAGFRAPGRPWWEWISGWVRVAVPVGVAASLVLAFVVPGTADLAAGDTTAVVAGADSTIVLAAFSEPGTGNQLTAHLIAPETSDWLLAQALDQ